MSLQGCPVMPLLERASQNRGMSASPGFSWSFSWIGVRVGEQQGIHLSSNFRSILCTGSNRKGRSVTHTSGHLLRVLPAYCRSASQILPSERPVFFPLLQSLTGAYVTSRCLRVSATSPKVSSKTFLKRGPGYSEPWCSVGLQPGS